MDIDKIVKEFWFPIAVVSAFYGIIFLIGLFFLCKRKRIMRACIMMTAFCLWLFWVVVYMAQMNPLFGPRLHNSTLAWMGEIWGDKLW